MFESLFFSPLIFSKPGEARGMESALAAAHAERANAAMFRQRVDTAAQLLMCKRDATTVAGMRSFGSQGLFQLRVVVQVVAAFVPLLKVRLEEDSEKTNKNKPNQTTL